MIIRSEKWPVPSLLAATCLACFGTGLLPSAGTGQAAGEASLDSIRLEFHAALKEVADPLTSLQDQYAARLATLQEQASKNGELDAVLEIREEIESFRSGGRSEAEASPQLRRAQKIYQDALDRRRAEFRRSVKPLLTSYLEALVDLEKRLTAAAQVDRAVAVRTEKTHIATLLEGDLSRVAVDLGVLDEGNAPVARARVTVIPENAGTDADVKPLEVRMPAATNRTYYFSGVPEEFDGFRVLRMEVRGNLNYAYEVEEKCLLHLLVHRDNFNNGSNPEADGWEKTGKTVTASGGFFAVYEKIHPPGDYELGSQGPWPYMLMTDGELKVEK